MFIKLLGFISIRWAINFINHATGQHVSGSWLREQKYNKQGY